MEDTHLAQKTRAAMENNEITAAPGKLNCNFPAWHWAFHEEKGMEMVI